ncbi:MAG: hypothetical protein WC969_02575 [Elusimicrobiota bacterium]|jgi:hypothetical protein
MLHRRLLLLAGLLAVQVLISLPRLNKPFLDGRAHWDIDSAGFLLRAIHSQEPSRRGPLDVFGLKRFEYGADGEVASAKHYAHHPVLPSLLFNACTRLTGYGFWAPRSFSLLFSLLTTALVFLLLLRAADDPLLAFAATLLHLLLPLYYNYQDAWKHEVLVSFFTWAVLLCLYELERPTARRLFPVLFFLLFQAGWAAYPMGAAILAYLRWVRRDALAPRALAVAAASAALNVLLLHALGADAAGMRAQAVLRMNSGLESVSLSAWAGNQLAFAGSNFGWGALAAACACLAYALARFRRRAHALTLFGGMAALSALAWVCVFRNQSHIHHYVQWLAGAAPPLAVLGLYCSLREKTARPARLRASALALLLALCAVSLNGGRRLEALIHEGTFATPQDVRAVADETRRLVVFLDGTSGPKDWWISPVLSLYTDPYYKAGRLGLPRARVRGTLVFADSSHPMLEDSDVLVTLNDAGTLRRALRAAGSVDARRCLRISAFTPVFAFLSPRRGAECRNSALLSAS